MSWPNAVDPFYLANTVDNNLRRTYYNVNGTPTFKCDGSDCATSQSAVQAAINARLTISSPIWLDEIVTVAGTEMTVTVKAVASQSISSGYTLQILLLDRYSYLPNSPNGQPHHYHAMLDMAPSGSGQNFTATANDTMTYTGTFPLNPSWLITNLDVACFVQNNTSKEIIQGHIEQAPVNFPNLSYVSHALDDNNNHDGRAEPNETAYLRVTLANAEPYQPATNVVGTLTTTDPTLTITTPTVNFPNIPNGGQGTNTANPFVFTVSPTAIPHYTTLHVHVVADPQQTTYDTNISMYIGWPDILLVDDDAADTLETYYKTAITSINKTYEYWNTTTQGTPPQATIVDHYHTMIWFNGNVATDPLTLAERTVISNFLNVSGHGFFLSGQNTAAALFVTAPTFLSDVLHATCTQTNTNIRLLTGVTSNPVGNGLNLNCNAGGTGAGNCTSPDAVDSIAPATIAFSYTGSSFYKGAITYQNPANAKVVFFAFPFEAISGQNGSSTREQTLQSIMNWFGNAIPPQNMEVTITPVSPPIVIPANGGSFPYNLNVHNLTTQSQTFAVWNKFRTPSGSYIAAFGPIMRTLPGGANPTRVLNQNVAATVPSGTIYYISYIGTYPSTIQDLLYLHEKRYGRLWSLDQRIQLHRRFPRGICRSHGSG